MPFGAVFLIEPAPTVVLSPFLHDNADAHQFFPARVRLLPDAHAICAWEMTVDLPAHASGWLFVAMKDSDNCLGVFRVSPHHAASESSDVAAVPKTILRAQTLAYHPNGVEVLCLRVSAEQMDDGTMAECLDHLDGYIVGFKDSDMQPTQFDVVVRTLPDEARGKTFQMPPFVEAQPLVTKQETLEFMTLTDMFHVSLGVASWSISSSVLPSRSPQLHNSVALVQELVSLSPENNGTRLPAGGAVYGTLLLAYTIFCDVMDGCSECEETLFSLCGHDVLFTLHSWSHMLDTPFKRDTWLANPRSHPQLFRALLICAKTLPMSGASEAVVLNTRAIFDTFLTSLI